MHQRDAERDARRIETGSYGPIRTYGDLVAYLRQRRIALGLSMIDLDERCGWQNGLVSHLEHWRGKNGRTAGPATLPRWFAALGVELKPVVTRPPADPDFEYLSGAQLVARKGAIEEAVQA